MSTVQVYICPCCADVDWPIFIWTGLFLNQMSNMRTADFNLFSGLKILIGILLSANMFYFVMRYRELTDTVRILQEQLVEHERLKLARKSDSGADKTEKAPEKPVDDEPPLEYSQVAYYQIKFIACVLAYGCLYSVNFYVEFSNFIVYAQRL